MKYYETPKHSTLDETTSALSAVISALGVEFPARLEEIPISGRFVTRLDICKVAPTPHIYKKPIQILPNSTPLNEANISTVERSVKHHC